MDNTTNYDLFKYAGINREVKKQHVQVLIKQSEALREDGRDPNITKVSPVLVDNNMVVVDGQHRIEANKALGLPVYYIKADLQAKDMISVNSKRKSWTIDDYINFYAKTGKEEYTKLQEIKKLNPIISYTEIVRFDRLKVTQYRSGIVEGTFSFLDYDKTLERVSWLTALIGLNAAFKLRPLATALVAALKTERFDPDVFYEAVRNNGGIFHTSLDINENYDQVMLLHDKYLRSKRSN